MILVTGFGPYHEDLNASGELVASLKKDLPADLQPLRPQLAFEVITCDDTSRETEHRTLEDQLAGLLKHYAPDLCIFTGQAPSCNKVTIEKIAINSFMREIIDPARPAAYWADLPGIDGLRTVLEDQGIPADYSFYAGQHWCNHILFTSLHFAGKGRLAHKSGFVHIPLLPEQVARQHRDAACMTLGMTRKALALVIRHVAEAQSQASAADASSR